MRSILGSIRIRLPRWLPGVALAIAGIAGLCWLLGPAFQVRHVEVAGAVRVRALDVAHAADLAGANLFLTDTEAAERRVLALHVPERVTIGFRLPDTAMVEIRERAPAYIWKVDPALYLVSEDGTVLGQTPEEDEPVIVVDTDHRPVSVGGQVDRSALQEAAEVTRSLPNVAGLSPPYVLYSRDQGIVVPLPEGIQVILGDDQNLTEKLREFGPVVDAARSQRPPATLVDLRYARHAYVR